MQQDTPVRDMLGTGENLRCGSLSDALLSFGTPSKAAERLGWPVTGTVREMLREMVAEELKNYAAG